MQIFSVYPCAADQRLSQNQFFIPGREQGTDLVRYLAIVANEVEESVPGKGKKSGIFDCASRCISPFIQQDCHFAEAVACTQRVDLVLRIKFLQIDRNLSGFDKIHIFRVVSLAKDELPRLGKLRLGNCLDPAKIIK